MKTCRSCELDKPLTEFWIARTGKTKDGYKNECKECAKARRRDWAARNKHRISEWGRAYHTANPEYAYNQRRAWIQANPEAARADQQRQSAKRRARKHNAFIEHVVPLIVLERDDGICGICNQDVDPLNFHIDHIQALARGGDHSYANVQLAHPSCNYRKGTR